MHVVFGLSSLLWGILAGLLIAIIALIASAVDSNFRAGMVLTSRLSAQSASRKLEFVSLLVPTIGVLALNQLVLTTPMVDFTTESVKDFVGLQWYWALDSSDVALNNFLSVGDLFGISVSNFAVLSLGVSLVALSAVDVIHALALPTLAVKADAIPGRCALVKISIETTGQFSGQCSELCGSMHGFMPIGILAADRKSQGEK